LLPAHDKDVHLESDQLCQKVRNLTELTVAVTALEDNILALDPAQVAEGLFQGLDLGVWGREVREDSDPRDAR
jgi:hypothetical protein